MDTAVVLGLALRDTISGTRLTEQVPMLPTRSRPTKSTLGWQQLDVKEAVMDVFTAPRLKASTKTINTQENKCRIRLLSIRNFTPSYLRVCETINTTT